MERQSSSFKENITIVYPPTIDWHLLYQRPHQLLTAFSKMKNIRSIFITNNTFKKLEKPFKRINKNLYVVEPNFNYKDLVRGKKVLYFTHPSQYSLSKNFDYVIFDLVDNPVDEFHFWQKGLDQSIKCADLIICTANVMYEYCKKKVRKSMKPVILVPNGADYEHFKKAQKTLPAPNDFKFKDEKIICFYGAMASWVDWDLILKIAEKHKVVLIGHNKYYRKIIRHKNILNLEHKDYSTLPYYLSQFTATLIPFKLTEMIKGCDPIKFYEYISAGKPVLATNIPELQKFKDIIYFIDHDNYEQIVQKALSEDDKELRSKRIEIAKKNSWEARATQIIDNLRSII